MRYRSETRFEILYTRDGGTPDSQTYKVPANGCNSIVFMALPMVLLTNSRFNFSGDVGISQLLGYLPNVNGVPLFPSILNSVFEPNQVYATAGNTLNDALTRLEPGDRLEFANAPGVVDETVYQVTHLDATQMGFKIPLMVIRRFLFPI